MTVDSSVSSEPGPVADGGGPALDDDRACAYLRYAGVDTLLGLQHPRTSEPEEYSFITTTQVMELLFALIRQRWQVARDALHADDVPTALDSLRRGTQAQDVLVASWGLLATLTPGEFTRIRESLGAASGFHSYGYRHLQFLLGEKSAAAVRPFRCAPHAHADLERALAEPSLYDAALGLLHRRGIPVPPERVERDWTQPYEGHPDVERAWARVYADERGELFELAERLLDTAERMTRWRQSHLMSVKRALGAKPGTGGSSGVEWLRASAERDVFPELWTLRTNT